MNILNFILTKTKKIDYSDKETIVLFKLLDKSPITGNIINPVAQISLEDAESLLKKK